MFAKLFNHETIGQILVNKYVNDNDEFVINSTFEPPYEGVTLCTCGLVFEDGEVRDLAFRDFGMDDAVPMIEKALAHLKVMNDAAD